LDAAAFVVNISARMSQRFWKSFFTTATVLAAILPSAIAATNEAPDTAPSPLPRRPSIVWIVADDLGYGDLACYGQRNIPTPNLDALAEGGLKLTSFYAGATDNTGARRALIYGEHAGNLRILAATNPAAPSVSLATLLQGVGYRTGALGLWGLPVPPNEAGFDEWAGFMTEGEAEDIYPESIWRHDPGIFTGKSLLDRSVSANDLIMRAAENFIRINKPDQFNKQRPFFLYVGHPAPRVYATNETGAFADRPWPAAEKAKAATIARLDADVGRLLAALKLAQIESNTLIIVTGDNAPTAARGVDLTFHRSLGGLRADAGGLNEGRLRVPCVFHWPGRVIAGNANDRAWAAWDILPTLAAIARATPPAEADGFSLWPLLTGQPQTERHDFLYWEQRGNGQLVQAARMGEWKANKPRADKPALLYNLQTDRAEAKDLATSEAAALQQLGDYMKQFAPARK
jgi:arylsulfatase A-like enzyme